MLAVGNVFVVVAGYRYIQPYLLYALRSVPHVTQDREDQLDFQS